MEVSFFPWEGRKGQRKGPHPTRLQATSLSLLITGGCSTEHGVATAQRLNPKPIKPRLVGTGTKTETALLPIGCTLILCSHKQHSFTEGKLSLMWGASWLTMEQPNFCRKQVGSCVFIVAHLDIFFYPSQSVDGFTLPLRLRGTGSCLSTFLGTKATQCGQPLVVGL